MARKDISGDVNEWYDTSNYNKDHPSGIHTNKNKKALGFFKDECGGNDIVEFVGLKPKSYSYETVSGKVEKKVKV